ncbi:MAG: type II toxin-antitoxin system PemK/MazF family toxin [Clostridia bacterium]|nr:type II toxin-antitoxin system PemK/MazF family toxin [Clostridia bacterium]
MRKLKFGDIYLYDFGSKHGSIQNGKRPVVIIQANDINENIETTIVAPITAAIKKTYLYSHVVIGSCCGLKKFSMIELEQMRTVLQSALVVKIGTIDNSEILKCILYGIRKTFNIYAIKDASYNNGSDEKYHEYAKYGEIYSYNIRQNVKTSNNEVDHVVVLQNNGMNKNSSTVLVAAVSFASKNPYLPSHIFLDNKFGMKAPSMILLEQISVINQADLKEQIGTITDRKVLNDIYFGMRRCFGMWNYSLNKKDSTLCLCRNCLSKFIESRKCIVKREDVFQRIKGLCSFCNIRYGYDYFTVPRMSSVRNENKTENRTFDEVSNNG